MSVTIRGPKYLLSPTLPNNSANPLFPLVTYLAIRGVGKDSKLNVDVVNDVAIISGIEDLADLPITRVAAVVQMGAEVLNYPVWIELTPTDYAKDVPNYLPNATDGAGNKIKWSEWKDQSHEHLDIDGKFYVGGNSVGGSELPGSIIAQLVAANFKLKTLAEMQAIVAAHNEASPE